MRSLQSSMHSLHSASNTSSSQYSIASKNLQSLPIYIYRQEKVIGIKHEATTKLDESEMAELRQVLKNLTFAQSLVFPDEDIGS